MNEFAKQGGVEIAIQFLREGKIKDCIDYTNNLVSADPNDATAYGILGAAYAQIKDINMAIASFQRAIEISPTARTYFNLGKVYEDAGYQQEALQNYGLANQLDQTYKPANDAISRLSIAPQTNPTSQMPAPAPFEQTIDMGAPANYGPQPLTAVAEPTVYAEQTAQQPLQAEIPKFVNQSRPGGPDLRDLEMRTRANDAKAQAAHKKLMKSGLIYGMMVGSGGFIGVQLMLGMFTMFSLSGLIMAAGQGLVMGGIIGFWIGYTCGDDITGLKVGALFGALTRIIPGLFHFSDLGIGWLIVLGICGAFPGGIAGFIIGKIVENSIGD